MRFSYIFLLSLILLPIQSIGLDLGFMTLKLSQFLFVTYVILIILNKRIHVKSLDIYIYMFLLTFFALLISTLFSESQERSFVLMFAYLLCIVFLFATINFLFKTPNSFVKIKNYLFLSSVIYSIYGGYQLLLFYSGREANVNFEAWDLVPRVPYFSAENVHAAFLLVIIPILYVDYLMEQKKVKTIVLFFILILNIVGIVATGSRGAILALILSILFLTIILRNVMGNFRLVKKVGFLSIIILFFVVKFFDLLFIRFASLFSGNDGTTSVRANDYLLMFREFSASPLFGTGLGTSLELTDHDVHNVFLQLLFEGGIVSFIPFIFSIGLIFYHFLANFRLNDFDLRLRLSAVGVFIAVVIQSMFEPSLYFYHFYFSVGLLIYSNSEMKNKIISSNTIF